MKVLGGYVKKANSVYADRIVKITYPDDERLHSKPTHWVRCSSAGCDELYRLVELRMRNMQLCKSCRCTRGELFGVKVVSDYIWSIRDKITGVTRSPKTNAPLWEITCEGLGCEKSLRLSSYRNKSRGSIFCRNCCHKKRPFEAAYNNFRSSRRLKRRGHKVELTFRQFVNLMKKPDCHYCGVPLRKRIEHGVGTADALMLDRKDSLLAYTAKNTVQCCITCNFTKGPYLSEAEMMLIIAYRSNDQKKAESLIRGRPRDHTQP